MALYSKTDAYLSSLIEFKKQCEEAKPAARDDDVTAQLNDPSSQAYAMVQDAVARQRVTGEGAVAVSMPPQGAAKPFKPAPTAFRFYVGKKGEKRLMLDTLPVAPTPKTLTSRDFKTAYAKQLHDTIYTSEEEVNFAAMVSLISVYDHAVSMNGKVPLTSSKYIYRMRDICSALSSFFTENKQVISSIATMVNNRVQDV